LPKKAINFAQNGANEQFLLSKSKSCIAPRHASPDIGTVSIATRKHTMIGQKYKIIQKTSRGKIAARGALPLP